MDLDKTPMPHPQVAARTLDNAAVIVLAQSGEVNVLNSVGTRIWGLADGTRTGHEIVRAIVAEFDVDTNEAAHDVATFLQVLVDAGALTVLTTPS